MRAHELGANGAGALRGGVGLGGYQYQRSRDSQAAHGYSPNFLRIAGRSCASRIALTTHMMTLFLASATSALVA